MKKSYGWGERTLSEEKDLIDELLNYISVDTSTGLCVWTVSTNRKIKIGSVAGTLRKDGYTVINFKGKQLRRHRIVYYVSTGNLPVMIDHKKGVAFGDGIRNLQEVTNTQNSQKKGMQKNNTSGFTGVTWNSSNQKWIAQITLYGKVTYLGSFDDPEEASNVYKKSALLNFGTFYNKESP
ncbi:putative homing endonuclease [Enterobacter phage EC-F2]|nr:putative homing endonuclease [Enterobacter phage EC-F2]